MNRLKVLLGQLERPYIHNGKRNYEETNQTTQTPRSNTLYDVIIIGGGSSGLSMAYRLHHEYTQYGLLTKPKYTIIEQSYVAGNEWNNRYDRLHLHTHKGCSSLPDGPMPNYYPSFLSKKQFQKYLESYVYRHNLNIIFGHKVVQTNYNNDKLWNVMISNQKNGNKVVVKGKIIVVCSGQESNKYPNIPKFDGVDMFGGQIMHSCKYKSPKKSLKYKSKQDNILVVGAGNTGTELAIDLYEYGFTNIDILIRSPMSIVRRHDVIVKQPFPNTITPIDDNINDKRDPINLIEIDKKLISLQNKHFNILENYGIKLSQIIGENNNKYGPATSLAKLSSPPVLDIGFGTLIKTEKIKVISNEINKFTKNGCIFKNGLNKKYDIILLATGFHQNDSWKQFLPKNIHDKVLNRYGLVNSEGRESLGQERLYFIGFNEEGVAGRINEMNYESRQVMKDIVAKYL